VICHTNGNNSLTNKNDEQTNIMAQTKANQDPLALKLMRTAFKLLTPLLPGTMSRYAYNLWLTPPRPNPPEREVPYINSAKSSTIMIEGQNIKLWTWGMGPTVLFVHGWGGRGTQVSCFVHMEVPMESKPMRYSWQKHLKKYLSKLTICIASLPIHLVL
jgi:hypothetical protein